MTYAHNLHKKFIDFEFILSPAKVNICDFIAESKLVCKDIANNYNNLYVAFSGGIDSEFIVRTMASCNITFQVVIVIYNNHIETSNAIKICQELDIKYTLIHITREQFFKTYFKEIFGRGAEGFNTVHLIEAARYINSVNGTAIYGTNFLGQGTDQINNSDLLYFAEWDFYAEMVFPSLKIVHFYLYNPNIIYNSIPFDTNIKIWQDYKYYLFNLSGTNKEYPKLPETDKTLLFSITQKLPKRIKYIKWTKDEIKKIYTIDT